MYNASSYATEQLELNGLLSARLGAPEYIIKRSENKH